MKLCFSDKFIKSCSFLELCNTVQSYEFDGVEIFDAVREKAVHQDSIFHSSVTVDAKRKLVNRHIEISAINFPEEICENTDADKIVKYVNYAIVASVKSVILKFAELPNEIKLAEILRPALSVAENNGIYLLIETAGPFANTSKVIEVINYFGSANLNACWNVRETFFTAGETADFTIQTLGAYICYVRLGDRKAGEDVLIGEGELPVGEFVNALRSLNYDGYVSVMDSGEITSADIILTHFRSYMVSKADETVAH